MGSGKDLYMASHWRKSYVRYCLHQNHSSFLAFQRSHPNKRYRDGNEAKRSRSNRTRKNEYVRTCSGYYLGYQLFWCSTQPLEPRLRFKRIIRWLAAAIAVCLCLPTLNTDASARAGCRRQLWGNRI
jgi:hypothetical protein